MLRRWTLRADGRQHNPSNTSRFLVPRRRNALALERLETRALLNADDLPLAYASAGFAEGASLVAQPLSATSMVVRTRDSYLPGIALLVQIELLGADGKPLRELWDADVMIGSSTAGVSFTRAGFALAGEPVTHVRVQNGVGSALVNVNGTTGAFNLTASYEGLNFSRTITSLASAPRTTVSGVLSGTVTTWSGVVHVTGDVTVPANHTLNVQPGTLVIINGTPPLPPNPDGATAEDGTSIDVIGTVNSLGTAQRPITFTAANPTQPWGEINHDSLPATYHYTEITRGGHSPQDGLHTDTGPIMRVDDTTLNFNYVSITDAAGKIMSVDDSQLNWQNVHFARSVMGPEINDTGLLWTDSQVQDLLGIYQEKGGRPDDNDGIYIHSQAAGQTVRIANVAFAEGDDDAIDTLGAVATFEDLIIRGYDNPLDDSKGISVTNGAVDIRRVLIVNCAVGIATKAFNTTPVNVTIDHVTVVTTRVGILAERAGGGHAGAILNIDVSNSIVQAPDSVHHEYAGHDFRITVDHSLLTETRTGVGNIIADPLFVNPAAGDYHLQFGSPAIDSGDPASPLDPDGTRTDMGYVPYEHSRVEARHIFYNQSLFDGNNAAANALDDGAIAPDKSALLPGGTATYANYTSYNNGINGIMIDVEGLAGTPTIGDFTFRSGNDNAPASWPLLATPPSISVRTGASVNGADRVTLIWPSFSVTKRWLQVTVNATAQTGLSSPDVFYFGNAIGEAGDSPTDARVTSVDEIIARNRPYTVVNPAGITVGFDFDRDMRVSAVDQIIARNNRTQILDALKLILVPAALQASGITEQGLDESSEIYSLSTFSSQSMGEHRAAVTTDPQPATETNGRKLRATNVAFAQLAALRTLPRRPAEPAELFIEDLELLSSSRARR